jgi:hypothetical protein
LLNPNNLNACSTFKLQKGNQLIYAHNLNQEDIGVPGMILFYLKMLTGQSIFGKGAQEHRFFHTGEHATALDILYQNYPAFVGNS